MSKTQTVPVPIRKRFMVIGTATPTMAALQRCLRRGRSLQVTSVGDSATLVATLAELTFECVYVDLTSASDALWDDLLYLGQMLPETPVVGILERRDTALEARAQDQGVGAFLTPPFTIGALQSACDEATQKLVTLATYRRAMSYMEASHRFHASLDVEELLTTALRELFRLSPCQKARVLLSELDAAKPPLGYEASFSDSGGVTLRGLDRDEAAIELATGMLNLTISYKESVLMVPLRYGEDPVGLLSVKFPRSVGLKSQEASLIEHLARHLALAVRNAQRHADLMREREQIFLINEVGRQVASCLDFDTILTDIVDHVRRYFAYDIVAIYLPGLTGPQGQNHFLASGIGGNVIIRASVLEGDLGLIHYVMNMQETVICHDLQRQSNWQGHHTTSRSKLVSPIWVDGNIEGALEFESSRPFAFDALDRRVAEDIAMQISVAVRNTRLYHQTQAAREYLQTLLDVAVDMGIISTDSVGNIITFSRGAELLFGVSSEEIKGLQIFPLFHRSSCEAVVFELFRQPMSDPWESDIQLHRRNGETFYASMTVRPLRATQSPGYLFVLLDITQRLNLQERLHRMSITDELTGLYNKRYLTTLLPRETSRAERQRVPLVLCYFDLDGFKKFNDSKGHVEGDLLLKWIGQLIQQVIRRNVDLPFRYGGDEFVLLLPGTYARDAVQVGERIRQAAEKQYNGEVTVSFGIAEYRGENPEAFTIRADQAMYRAKRAGGNQVVVDEDLTA
ncbi:MAG: diguanylate cyclase [Blastocatellia bacterium]|nr:diguanylate cyclase [Blastocatellia bacterium]